MPRQSPIIRKMIIRFSQRWDIPADKLFTLYKIYQKTALQGGELSAIFRALGFILDRRRINYMIRRIKIEIMHEVDKKF